MSMIKPVIVKLSGLSLAKLRSVIISKQTDLQIFAGLLSSYL